VLKAILSLSRRKKQTLAVATDLLLLLFAFWSALALRFETWTPNIAAYQSQMLAAPLLAIPIFIRLGLYRAVIRFMEDRVVFVVAGGVTLSVLLLAAGLALTHTPGVSRGVLAIYWLLAILYVGATRFLARSYFLRAERGQDSRDRGVERRSQALRAARGSRRARQHAAARRVHAQRDVDALFHQIHDAIGDGDVHADFRVPRHERRNHFADDRLGQGDRAAYPQHTTRLGVHLGHHIGSGLGFLAHGHAVAKVLSAHVGQGDPSGGALEQPHTQAPFQFGDPARQPGGWQAERTACSGKAATFGDFGEKQHVVEILHGA